MKLICWGKVVFVCPETFFQWFYVFDGKNNFASFLLHDHCILIFRQVFHMLLFVFYRLIKKWFIVNYRIKIFEFYWWHKILIRRTSCRIIDTIFEWKNKQSINIPKCCISHIIQIVVFGLLLFQIYIYAKILFFWILASSFLKT